MGRLQICSSDTKQISKLARIGVHVSSGREKGKAWIDLHIIYSYPSHSEDIHILQVIIVSICQFHWK
jgi:hypothetical protein